MNVYDLIFPLQVAVVSWVYVHILTQPDMILGWWSKWLHSVTDSEWLLKPLVDCEYCVAGQIALWGYLLMPEYGMMAHMLCIFNSIFVVKILNVCLNN